MQSTLARPAELQRELGSQSCPWKDLLQEAVAVALRHDERGPLDRGEEAVVLIARGHAAERGDLDTTDLEPRLRVTTGRECGWRFRHDTVAFRLAGVGRGDPDGANHVVDVRPGRHGQPTG